MSSQTKITQISLFNILICGKYDGVASVQEVKQHGSIAIGTMEMLDGEMIMVDRKIYQIQASGQVNVPADTETIPFGTIADFVPDQVLELKNIPSFEAFETKIDQLTPDINYPLAVCFHGFFPMMRTRSVPRLKNGIGLAAAAEMESRFEMKDTEGDLIGFRLPPYVKGINAPGWHLHYIDSARKNGGHVVNFVLDHGTLQTGAANDFRILLPEDHTLYAGVELSRDYSRELQKAEAER